METDDEAERIPGDDPSWLRPAIVAAVFLIGFVVLLAAVNSDDAGTSQVADRDPVVTTTTEAPTPADLCARDLSGLVEFATRDGSTQDSAMNDILTTYGSQDPRTQVLIQAYGTFQSEVYQLGNEQASINFYDTVMAWCAGNASSFYG